MNIWALLEEAAGDAQNTGGGASSYLVYIIFGVVIVGLVVWFVFSGRKNKTRQQEYVEQLEAIQPGNKVKSAGGLCGVVVEVCDDNTVIIETGSENSGKSYFKLDKESIYQTDAKGPTQIAREKAEAEKLAQKAAAAEAKAQAKEQKAAEETPAEEPAEEAPATPEEALAEEVPAQETPEEAPTEAEGKEE